MTKNFSKYFIDGGEGQEGFSSCTISEVIEYCSSKILLSLDCETTGLDPFLDKVIMLQIGDLERGFAIDTRKVDITPLKELLENDSIKKVGVNIKFDAKMLLANYGFHTSGLIDVGIVERALNTHSRKEYFSMARLAKQYLGIDLNSSNYSLFPDEIPDKSTAKEFLKITTEDFTKRQINYGLLDVVIPLEIYKKQLLRIREEDQETLIQTENNFLEATYHIESNGMFVDSNKWISLYEKNLATYNWQKFLCNSWLRENGIYHYEGINWNSSKQVIKLFKELKIPTHIIDKLKSKGDDIVYKDSVQESHIAQYKHFYPLIPKYLKLKKYNKFVTSFGLKFLKDVHPITGRLHTNFYPILATGRVSSSGPNMQQIPALVGKNKAPFRECFVPQTENHRLVTADFSSQEVRTVADKANERVLLDFYNNGDDDDVHSLTARKMFKVEVSKHVNSHLRQRAKTLLFGILYGISSFKVAKDFGVSVKEAEKFIELFYQSYPSLRPYFLSQQRFFIKHGFIYGDLVTRRRIKFYQYDTFKYCDDFINRYESYGWWDAIPSEIKKLHAVYKGMLSRNAQNYPIQSQAASITKVAVLLVHKHIKENNLWNKIKIVMIVHDEIVLETTKEYAEEARDLLERSMIKAGSIFCTKTKMKVDTKISQTWSH